MRARMLVAVLFAGCAAAPPAAAQLPNIAGFTPEHGEPGTLVKIVGTGLSSVIAIHFRGAPDAAFHVWSDTHLKVTVPAEAQSGPIVLETAAGTVSTRSVFFVQLPSPAGTLSFPGPAPNPVSATTRWRFSLARPGPVRLTVRDLRGAVVTRVVNEPLDAGTYAWPWNLLDRHGRGVPSGVYWGELEAEGVRLRRPVVVVR